MTENLAAVLYGPQDLRIEKWPMPTINDNEVLVKMECVGICGSDVKIYTAGKCGSETITQPMVMGHEGAGVVIEAGAKVKNVKVGDRVAIEPTQPCRQCECCRQGKYNLCDLPVYCSTAGAHGNLCQYYKHVADFCYKIPDNLSMEQGAVVQPLAIAIHACNRASLKLGLKLLIMGAGPIGVLCAMTAKAMGVSKIVIADIAESRLKTALELGVDYILHMKGDEDEKQIAERILNTLGGSPDVTIDACGAAAALRVAIAVTKTAGVILVVGIGEKSVDVPLGDALLREVDIRGSFRIMNTYQTALDALASGAINLKPFITDHYPLKLSKEALEHAKLCTAMKIIIHL